jgi:ABC-type glycerol-3-phosphate transport system substrate-binding protein
MLLVDGSDYDAFNIMRDTTAAGSDDYDLFINNSYTTAQLAAEGNFIDLTGVEYVDLEKPYWSQGYNWSSSVGGHQYLATGKGFLGFYRSICITCFNKSLFQRFGVEEPYAKVLEGAWTVDYQNSVASLFYEDLNGNGVRDEADRYGYVTNGVRDTGINDGFWAALDLRLVGKDEEGWYIPTMDLDKFSSAIDKLLALLYGDGSGRFGEAMNDTPTLKCFTEGRAAMINNFLNFAESGRAREMEDDYGILPMAKSSEDQSEYYALDQDQFIVYGIPLTVPEDRIDKIGIFLEAYASESFAVVRPAYYEIALSQKYANDRESVEMLDLVTNSVYVDPAILYLTMSPINIYFLRDLIAGGQNTTASSYAKVEKTFRKFLEKLNKLYGMEG